MTLDPKQQNKRNLTAKTTGRHGQSSLLVLLALIYLNAEAGPTVIYDSGDARPISDLMPEVKPELPQNLPTPTPSPGLADAFVDALFPIHSPSLSPGDVDAKAVALNVPRPFFLVGNDGRSQNWVSAYCGRLKAINAAGIMVEVENLCQFKAMADTCPGLALTPMRTDALAKQLALSHYPALVSGRRIEQ